MVNIAISRNLHVGLRVWSRRQLFSKKINNKTGSIQPPHQRKTKVKQQKLQIRFFLQKRFDFLYACATGSELPSFINIMLFGETGKLVIGFH